MLEAHFSDDQYNYLSINSLVKEHNNKNDFVLFSGVIGLTDLTGTYGGMIMGSSGKSGGNSFHSIGEPPQWLTEPPQQVKYSKKNVMTG